MRKSRHHLPALGWEKPMVARPGDSGNAALNGCSFACRERFVAFHEENRQSDSRTTRNKSSGS